MKDLLKQYAANENNPKWDKIIERKEKMYSRGNDIRSEFERDYTRIIHCSAYRRLKHKTQVFFSPESDHICTRIEHVTHVESISYTIAKYFGLNTELTKAIATAHDIGHSPFGHQGESILSKILMREINETFWHEKNGLDFVDKIELLEDDLKNKRNLNLTYAVRDGIISHCGEIDENRIKPREEYIDLEQYQKPNQYAPYTWEACVVKIADKIAYLGRDIEDAIKLGILDNHLGELYKILDLDNKQVINNTVIINKLVQDLCENSSIENGLCFSEETFDLINKIKLFNYENIYSSERLKPSNRYFEIVINEIYNTFRKGFKNYKVAKEYNKVFPEFEKWLSNYWNMPRREDLKNKVLFDVQSEKDYCRAVVYYISGMTDNFAIKVYNDIVGF